LNFAASGKTRPQKYHRHIGIIADADFYLRHSFYFF
jgi:hypothetical protein